MSRRRKIILSEIINLLKYWNMRREYATGLWLSLTDSERERIGSWLWLEPKVQPDGSVEMVKAASSKVPVGVKSARRK